LVVKSKEKFFKKKETKHGKHASTSPIRNEKESKKLIALDESQSLLVMFSFFVM